MKLKRLTTIVLVLFLSLALMPDTYTKQTGADNRNDRREYNILDNRVSSGELEDFSAYYVKSKNQKSGVSSYFGDIWKYNPQNGYITSDYVLLSDGQGIINYPEGNHAYLTLEADVFTNFEAELIFEYTAENMGLADKYGWIGIGFGTTVKGYAYHTLKTITNF